MSPGSPKRELITEINRIKRELMHLKRLDKQNTKFQRQAAQAITSLEKLIKSLD